MTYHFSLKDNGSDIDIILTRALLTLTAVGSLVYHNHFYFIINIAVAVILFLTAIFVKSIVKKFRVHTFLLMGIASVLLFLSTGSFIFALILLAYGSILKLFYKPPSVEISEKGILLKKLFSSPFYKWNAFSNIILKDQLLTLDFANNKLLQLNVDESMLINQKEFNDFCVVQLQQ